jgi:succinate dehydrogenase / fumarate reductase cytochrome b subunit
MLELTPDVFPAHVIIPFDTLPALLHCGKRRVSFDHVKDDISRSQMAHTKSKPARPLSPHLQIYRPMLTMMMSIFHRLTGIANYFGMLLLAWWLAAAASGPDYFAYVNGIIASPIGRLILFGLTWSLMHHMLGGIRHFIWDTGRGFALPTVELLARLTIIGSLALTIALWGLGYHLMGAF